jgi:hypothetical protein
MGNQYPIALLIKRENLEKICKVYRINEKRLINRAKASMEKLSKKDIIQLMKARGQK